MESSSVLNCIHVEKKIRISSVTLVYHGFMFMSWGKKKPQCFEFKPVLLYTKAISKVHKVFLTLHLWLVSKIPGICWNHLNTGVQCIVHVMHVIKNKFENCRHSWSYIEA